MNKALHYPLDTKQILRKKRSLKRALLEQENLEKKHIAILGGSTTAEVKNILELFLLNNGIEPLFYESDYNKYYEDALFGNAELDAFKPDVIYVHTSHVNISNFPKVSDSEEDVKRLIEDELRHFTSVWEHLDTYNCAIVQNNFDYTYDRSLGNMDGYDVHGKSYVVNELNRAFRKAARERKNLYINDIHYLSAYVGLQKWFDRSLWYQAKYAMSLEAIPELAFGLSKIINAIFGQTKKCLVLDLDNTCWGGVIGDDGLDGIQIGSETAIAEAYSTFQKYASELKERGITLAVCSKNDSANAKEGFTHPDSVLKVEDFTAFKANWEPKHTNIVAIAQEINIGLDSLVFIDDNPVERDIVASQIPQVTVPDVGSEIVDFIDHIDKNGYFEPITLSLDDIQRNSYYEGNKKRAALESSFASYEDFLLSLKMQAEIEPFSSVYLERITQLTNKTNQFNLTTRRYTAAEIASIAQDSGYITLYGKLTDKYGDNGLISIVIGKVVEKELHIDLWLMSCRVLKRDMEYAMLDALVKASQNRGLLQIVGYYYKSAKNKMVSELYKDFGFTLQSQDGDDSIWKLEIDDYKNKNRFIEVNND